MEHEHADAVDAMLQCFNKVRLEGAGARAVLAVARYLYLWDLIDEADASIQPIFDAIYKLRIADDTFLYLRGLPVFSELFGYGATYAILRGDPQHAGLELQRASEKLAECDVTLDRLRLNALTSSDWNPVLSWLDVRLAEWEQNGFPVGRLRMQRAVISSRASMSTEESERQLRAIQLTEGDHWWLEDIRTLCLAEIANRDGRLSDEEGLLATFLSKQPLLFEPNHAFDFGFISYQELIKPRYQQARAKRR